MNSRGDNYIKWNINFGITMLVLTLITTFFGSSLLMNFICICLLTISIILYFVLIFIKIPDYPKAIEERKILREEKALKSRTSKFEYKKQIENYKNLYGEISKEISLIEQKPYEYNCQYISETVLIFESSSKLIVKNKVINFKDLIAFELKDDEQTIYKGSTSTSTSSTSTGSLIGRAFVGGVLLGGVGAVIGGATAKKEITTTHSPQQSNVIHNYKVFLIINTFSESQIALYLGENEKSAYDLAAILSVILERNKITE